MGYKEEYNRWLKNVSRDNDLSIELNKIKDDNDAIFDAFYRDLEFGTAGLRGIIGVGTNRINIYTVGKATQGLANYINKTVSPENRIVAIGYDSRIKSDLFAKITAGILAANNIKVVIYKELMPVPCLAFATRELGCAYGVMITASHNPSKYNGYKVFGPDGCQIISEVAAGVFNEICSLDIFKDVKWMEFDKGVQQQLISYIQDEVVDKFIDVIRHESLISNEKVNKDVKIIYSPLHGTGLKPVLKTLKLEGYKNIIVVKEQENPDGNFLTCPYPNPEIKEAMELGIEYARRENADLLFATDPDCDRIGIAVKDKNNEYVLITGNQVGALLLNYICELRIKNMIMPKNAVAVKTIVTTDIADDIANEYGITLKSVLTGFKYIGEQIGILESQNRVQDFILGFEESYGYLTGPHVRDKDAVNGSLMIVDMFAYYKTQGISLLDKLEEFYKKFGYYKNTQKSYSFEGSSGFNKMKELMVNSRKISTICGRNVNKIIDYALGVDGLPASNVIKFLCDDFSVILRPSGTEPKLKVYLSVKSDTMEKSNKITEELIQFFDKFLK
ncbi:MAG: phospho-sugar mutase [Bacilli bacterium]|nr:phospho-sugar mutase [Bacilli bacterium]